MDHQTDLNLRWLFALCDGNHRALAELMGTHGGTTRSWLSGYREPCAAVVRLLYVFDQVDAHSPAMLRGFIADAKARAGAHPTEDEPRVPKPSPKHTRKTGW